jgi:hypothetical protein
LPRRSQKDLASQRNNAIRIMSHCCPRKASVTVIRRANSHIHIWQKASFTRVKTAVIQGVRPALRRPCVAP